MRSRFLVVAALFLAAFTTSADSCGGTGGTTTTTTTSVVLDAKKTTSTTTTTTVPATTTSTSTTTSSTTTSTTSTTTTLATTSTSTTTTTVAPPTYKFADEFNGTSLNLSKWQPNWWGSDDTRPTHGANSAEIACMDPANVSEPGDGYLHMKLEQRSCYDPYSGTTYPYAGALIHTGKDGYTFGYGTIEARVWTPPTDGTAVYNWPAFWLTGGNPWPTNGEIDVMEGLHGNDCWHFHYSGGAPGGCPTGYRGGWHTYKTVWTASSLTFYYDGNLVGTVTSGVTSTPEELIFTYTCDNTYGGPISTPQEMLVDWVHVS